MHRDPTEFRERFKRWKAGERVYDSGQALPAYEDGKSPDDLTNNRSQDEKEISWMYNWLNQRRDVLLKNAESVGWGYDKYYPKRTTGDVRDAGWRVERYANPWNPFTYFNNSDPTRNRVNKLIYAQIENARNTPKTEVGSGTSSDYNLRGVYVEPNYWDNSGHYVAFAGTPDSDVKVHEFTHASHPKQLEYYIMNNIFGGAVPNVTYKKRSNLENAKEIYGALQQFRYKNNLKPELKITKDWLQKNLNLFEDSYLKDLSDDIKLKLFNDVAMNDKTNNGTVVYANYGKSPKRYDDGKTPEETYYGKRLPTVTIEGHKPTLLENIGNWFVDASKRAAFNENPAVMTASGWTPQPNGTVEQDAFNTPERNQLADNLALIGEIGLGEILPEAIFNPALEFGLKRAYKFYLKSPSYKNRVVKLITDAYGDWDKTDQVAEAIIDDLLRALKKQTVDFVDYVDPENHTLAGLHNGTKNYVSIKDRGFFQRLNSAWHELAHGTQDANPLIRQLNDRHGVFPLNTPRLQYPDGFREYMQKINEIRAHGKSSEIPAYLSHYLKNNTKIPFRKKIGTAIENKLINQNRNWEKLWDWFSEDDFHTIHSNFL